MWPSEIPAESIGGHGRLGDGHVRTQHLQEISRNMKNSKGVYIYIYFYFLFFF